MKYTYFEEQAQRARKVKEEYPAGTRILLVHMDDDPHRIPDNTRGTVKGVDDIGTVHVLFDNRRNMGVIPGIDDFRKLTPAECANERMDSRAETV